MTKNLVLSMKKTFFGCIKIALIAFTLKFVFYEARSHRPYYTYYIQ